MEKLKSYPWPGNVRELRHTIEKSVILSDSGNIQPEDFAFGQEDLHFDLAIPKMKLEEMEQKMIMLSLKNNNWNIAEAARELGIGRQTLYRKIERYGI